LYYIRRKSVKETKAKLRKETKKIIEESKEKIDTAEDETTEEQPQ
jgi:hypothetical protein